ncbi:MAG: hypothetical protein JO225_01280 [Candidatus Eremiobacteraeota bacterium]|nr:hypothetical protein [Candidatus Eremiobacteraeota bacterium]MBV8642532.1 hypothetical protein [Candidatus Eremiobacteraeota bacterium]
MRHFLRWAMAAVLALGACAGAAVGAEMLFGDPASLVTSSSPSLLGPITENGRTGWDCAPEHAATAHTAAAAGLPHD